jgi:hypothetical protein
VRASGQVFDQSGIGAPPNPSQQNQIKVLVVGDDLEIITRFNSPARPNRFRYHELSALADIGRHEV